MSSEPDNKSQSDVVSPPGETLGKMLDERGMSQAELAERTGRPKKTINEIVKGKASITAETALQLERVLGAPAAFWNSREREYQEHLARAKEVRELRGKTDWLRRVPLRELINRGWVREEEDKVSQLREVLMFFGIASPEQWRTVYQSPQAAFRRPPDFEVDERTLSAWLRRGDIEAQRLRCAEYDEPRFRDALGEIRELTRKRPAVAIPAARDVCTQAGVALVVVPHFPGCPVQGASRWLTPSKALIQLSLRSKTDDVFWFGFFHEAGHILLHPKRQGFLDDKRDGKSEWEEEADRFAADTLIPEEGFAYLQDLLGSGKASHAKLEKAARTLGVSPSIVAGRLQHEGVVPQNHFNRLKRELNETAILAALATPQTPTPPQPEHAPSPELPFEAASSSAIEAATAAHW